MNTRRCLIVGLGLVTLAGCSERVADRLTRFFFEVPPEGTSVDAEAPPSDGAADHAGDSEEPPPSLAALTGFVSVHQPVAERNCAACHDADRRMSVRADLNTACQNCHPRYFSDEVGHPPVKRAHCHKCHDMHRSRQPDLLTLPLFNTCMQCHDEPAKLSPEAHQRADVQNCTRCHDPHFGEDVRLKPGAPWPGEPQP